MKENKQIIISIKAAKKYKPRTKTGFLKTFRLSRQQADSLVKE